MKSQIAPRQFARWLALLPVAMVALFVIAPTVNIFVSTFKVESLDILRTTPIHRVIWFTTWQALVSTAVAITLALPVAFIIANFKFKTQRLFVGAISVPFILPSIVVGAAFLEILPNDLHRTAFALIIAHVYFNFGFASRLIANRWIQIHPHLDEAARTLGATPFKVFATITMPLLRRSITNACLVIFTFCFTSFGIVRILGGPARSTIETEIYFRTMQLGDVSGGVVLSALQILMIVAIFYLGVIASKKTSDQTSRTIISRQKTNKTARQKALVRAIFVSTLTFVALPISAIFVKSVVSNSRFTTHGWSSIFTDAAVAKSLQTSLTYALMAVVVASLLAVLGSSAIVYGGKKVRFVNAITSLPILISAVSIGLGIIITFDAKPIDWRGSQLMLPLAHALVALPLAMRMLEPVLQSIPTNLRNASSVLGANFWQTWLNIDLKIARRAIISVCAITAAVSLGEFGASSFLARRNNETLPLAISRLLSRPGETIQLQAYALSSLLIIFSIALIFVIDKFGATKDLGGANA